MKSNSLVALSAVALVAISISAGYFGLEWQKNAKKLKPQIQTSEMELQKIQKEVAELRPLVQSSSKPSPEIAKAYASAFHRINGLAKQHEIVLSNPNFGASASTGAVNLAGLGESVGGSDLKYLSVGFTGTYKNYAGLNAFSKSIQSPTDSMHLSYLSIKGERIEFKINIYGK